MGKLLCNVWGDESIFRGIYDDAFGKFVEFYRDAQGVYTVRPKVTDSYGVTATAWTTVTVSWWPACIGLSPGYWNNWPNHYTEEQFLFLLEGTIAEGDTELADFYLSSLGYKGGDALHCMRLFLLANQLTLNATQHPELPNPDDASLFPACQMPGVEGDLEDWLDEALAIHAADGAGYDRDWILRVKDALDEFANLESD